MYTHKTTQSSTYRMFMWVAITLGMAAVLAACGGKKGCKDAPALSQPLPQVKINRLDLSFWKTDTTPAAIGAWLDLPENKAFLAQFRKAEPNMPDSAWLEYMTGMRKDKFLDTMRQETAQVMGQLTDLETSFSEAFGHLKHYYPKATVPTINAFVTGYSYDVSLADSTMIMIGLESFLEGKGRYTPPLLPMYMLRRLKRTAIVPLSMMAISGRYNQKDILDATLVADMVQWGKTYYFMEKMMPCMPDSMIIGYTPAEMDFAQGNEKLIYSKFVQGNWFYMTNHLEKRRYVEERPKVPEISESCPGRIARYIGWQVVRSYAEKTGKALPEIMAEKNAQTIFQQSGYKP